MSTAIFFGRIVCHSKLCYSSHTSVICYFGVFCLCEVKCVSWDNHDDKVSTVYARVNFILFLTDKIFKRMLDSSVIYLQSNAFTDQASFI